MTLYQCSLRQSSDKPGTVPRKWSNTFFIDAASAVQAAAAMVGLWQGYLRNACFNRVFAYEVYATDLAQGTDDYAIQAIPAGSQRGTLDDGGMEAYLAKACLAVTLSVTGSRPSRKFWRVGLTEGMVINGVSVDLAIVEEIRDAWALLFLEQDGVLRDPDGQPLTGVQSIRLTTREFGRESTNLVPTPPPFG